MTDETNDIQKMCDDVINKVLLDRSRFVDIFVKHCSENEGMKEKFGGLLLEKSDVYDTKEGLTNLLRSKIEGVLKDFYKEAIIGKGEYITALNKTPVELSNVIMNDLKESNEEMYDVLKENSINFEDIVLLDDRAVQKVLREVDQQLLAKALKGASEEVCNKIYNNMSKRAGQMLKEDIDFMGPVPSGEVLRSRNEIRNLIIALEDNGDIVIARPNQDALVY